MARSDMLRISGLVDDRHICIQAEAARCHSQAEAVRLICSLGLTSRNTRFRQWTLGTTSWRAVKVTPQVARSGEESAVYDCLVLRMSVISYILNANNGR